MSDIRPGPIRHDSLPPHLLDRIQAVFGLIGPYLSMTLEEFEIGFMRDLNPEGEVAAWCGIAGAWIGYHKKYLGGKAFAAEEEKKMIGALIAISAGVEEAGNLGVPEEVGRGLIECYRELMRRG